MVAGAASAAASSSCSSDGLSSFGGRKPRAVVATVAPSPSVMELQAEHERLMQRVSGWSLKDASIRRTSRWRGCAMRPAATSPNISRRAAASAGRPSRCRASCCSPSRASVGGGPYVVEAAYPLAA